MRVVITGGREYEDELRVFMVLDQIHQRRPITLLIEGGARGADRFGRHWAQLHGVPYRTFEVSDQEWNSYLGHRAGNRRNQRMLDEGKPEFIIVFPGNRGTRDMRSRAKLRGLKGLLVDHPIEGTRLLGPFTSH